MRGDPVRGETVGRRAWSRVWPVVLAAVGLAVVWLAVFGIVRGYQFVEDDARFCRTCHTMRVAWDQWQSSEHQEVTCHSCHESDMVGSLRQVWRYITQRPDDVQARAEVSAATCLNCHRVQEEAASIVSTDMHHAAGERMDCPICHGQELHHFEAPLWSDICASCH